MNILYTLNDKFVPQVSAGITSVCENNKDVDEITFYLMSLNISDKNKQKLKRYVKKYNRVVKIIELENLQNYFDFEFDTSGWNPIVLARLLLDKLLPKSIDRILYLDGDTIVRGSLKKLWETNMKKFSIAASIEPTIDKKRKKILKIDKYPYYNAGVLLIDMVNWRKYNTGNEIIDYYKKNNGQLFANDQDAINGSQQGKIYTLSPTYNFYNIFYQYNYKFLNNLMKPVKYISEKEYNEAVNDPIIIHYLGEERPWRIGNKHRYKEDYIKYLSMTPWANEGFENGWELYFKLWYLFNTITKFCPRIRYLIINSLIPIFIKYRAKKNKRG